MLSIGHMLSSPTPRSLICFGVLTVAALLGTRSIDAKRRRALGEAWEGFEQQTSNVPFAAILAGRQQLVAQEIGLIRPIFAILLSAVAIAAHGSMLSIITKMGW